MTVRHATRARGAVFAPLGDPGRAARVEQRLAEAIRSGLLADGERLPSESELAAMLGVATVTAREALVGLRAQGLVTTVRGRGGGSFVTRPKHPDDAMLHSRLTKMSRVELRDRGAVYRVLLSGCAELAAQHADSADLELLGELLVDPGVDDPSVWRHADSELALSLAALTQSARLTRELVRHEADFGTLLRMPLRDPEHRAEVAERHRSLLTALEAHDAQGARQTVQQHVDDAVGRLVEIHSEVRR